VTLIQAAPSEDEHHLSACCFYNDANLRSICQSSETTSLSLFSIYLGRVGGPVFGRDRARVSPPDPAQRRRRRRRRRKA